MDNIDAMHTEQLLNLQKHMEKHSAKPKEVEHDPKHHKDHEKVPF